MDEVFGRDNLTVRERMHDEDSYERGEVYRYDRMGRMGRMTKYWTNVALTTDYTTTDPTSAGSCYDDLVEHAIGKVYERQSVTVTPDGGSADVADYYYDPTETNEIGYQYGEVDGTTLAWDDNGQLTDDGTWDYEWTALGQLHRAYGHATEADRTMTYDAFGRRVQLDLSGGGGSREYLYHGWHMIGESDGTDWLWMEVPMAYGEGMLEHIALDTEDIDGDTNTTEYRQYAVQEDFQSTVWALSDVAGEIVERYVQDDPYGVSHTLDASDTDLGQYASEVYHRKRMHGGVTDAVLGLYDFRNRWLVPERGQWVSRDPLGAVDSWNLNQALLARPAIVSDHMGLCTSGGGCQLGGGPGFYRGEPLPWLLPECDCPCSVQDFSDVREDYRRGCEKFMRNTSAYPSDVQEGLKRFCSAVQDRDGVLVQCGPCEDPKECANIKGEGTSGGTDQFYRLTLCCARRENTQINAEGRVVYSCSVGCETLMQHEFGHIAVINWPGGVVGWEEPRNPAGDLDHCGPWMSRCLHDPQQCANMQDCGKAWKSN